MAKTALWFDVEYLDSFTVVAVSPQPVRGKARGGERAFVFETDGAPFSATLHRSVPYPWARPRTCEGERHRRD